jgi:sugar-phosphatase
MDGVIIDSRAVIELAWREAARRHAGQPLSDRDIREHVHGRTGRHTIAALFPGHSEAERQAIWAEVDAMEETARYDPVPGVRELIATLSARQVATGLVTSSWPAKIRHVIAQLGLHGMFRVIVSRDDVARGKPDPDPYLTGCRRIGCRPAQCLVFEDSVSGVRSATAAGATCIGIGIGGTDLIEAGACLTVPDFTHLTATPDSAGTLLLATRPSATSRAAGRPGPRLRLLPSPPAREEGQESGAPGPAR